MALPAQIIAGSPNVSVVQDQGRQLVSYGLDHLQDRRVVPRLLLRSSGSGVLSRYTRGVFGTVLGRLKTISSSSSMANAASVCFCILAASRCDFLRLFFMADLTITTWQSSTVLKNT